MIYCFHVYYISVILSVIILMIDANLLRISLILRKDIRISVVLRKDTQKMIQ